MRHGQQADEAHLTLPLDQGEPDRQPISRYPASGASDSLEIPVTPLWEITAETLTSALVAYRDLAPIFMIRAVVKTWKTS